MKKPTFLLSIKDERIIKLMEKPDKKILAVWAIDCAERVLPFFEKQFPEDKRPREALKTLQEWIHSGIFSMATIRKASLNAHAAAREVGADTPARSAARAAGQAVATAHVYTHSRGSALYALQAIHRNTLSEKAVKKEQEWQYKRLLKLSGDQN